MVWMYPPPKEGHMLNVTPKGYGIRKWGFWEMTNPSWVGLMPYQRGCRQIPCPFHHVRTLRSLKHRRGPSPARMALCFWISRLENCAKEISVVYKLSVCVFCSSSPDRLRHFSLVFHPLLFMLSCDVSLAVCTVNTHSWQKVTKWGKRMEWILTETLEVLKLWLIGTIKAKCTKDIA